LEEFVNRWAQHIPERYQHAVRSFGLFAPRTLGQTAAAIFAILGQKRKPRPSRRSHGPISFASQMFIKEGARYFDNQVEEMNCRSFCLEIFPRSGLNGAAEI